MNLYLIIRKLSFIVYKILYPNNSIFVKKHKTKFSGLKFIDFGAYKFEWYSEEFELYVGVEPNIHFNHPDFIKENNPNNIIITDIIGETNTDVIFYHDDLASGTSLSSLTNKNASKFHVKTRQLRTEEILAFENAAIKINIEGAEYDLLRYLNNIQVLKKAKYILLQTHPLNNTKETFLALLEKNKILKENGFRLTYKIPLIWELWKK